MECHAAKWLLPFVAAVSTAAPIAAQQPDELTIVRGRAIDRDGKPFAKCAVGVFEQGADFATNDLLARPAATTDADGRYTVRAPKSRYQVVVVATKGHQVCVQRLQPAPGAEREMPDALMLPGTTLRGRVRDANGKPLAGALVRVEDPLTEGVWVTTWFESRARSDERGIFEVPGVPSTGLRVTASARGFPAVSRLAAHDSPLDLTLRATGVVRGRVVDGDGKPVAGIRVSAITVERNDDVQLTDSDAEGRFEITAPNAFRFRVAAYESREPYRRFSSGLLRGPADDVVVSSEATKRHDAIQVTLRVVDAATKAKIEEFAASWSSMDPKAPASVLLYRPEKSTVYRGEAVFDVVREPHNKTYGSILVEARGRAATVVAVPDDVKEPIVAELQPECVLTGQVIDDATGKPAVGAAVRALPRSNMYGDGPDPWKTCAITDANGRYRIGGLAAGPYGVQAYGVGRQGAPSRSVTVATDNEGTLDLTIPKPANLEFEVVGDVPANSLARIGFSGMRTTRGGMADDGPNLEPPLPALPTSLPIDAQRAYKVGPVCVGEHEVQVWLPTRDRLGSGLAIPIGSVERGKMARLQLPDLRQVLHTGRVRLPSGVPAERIAVIAHPHTTDAMSRAFLQAPFGVGIASDGTFAIELPPGAFTLQLVDLETMLAFHTEAKERTFDATPATIEITPALRWLHLALESTEDDAPIVLQGFGIEASSSRRGVPAMLRAHAGRNERQTGSRPFPAGTTELHWLIPETDLKVSAMQTFQILSPTSSGWQGKPIDDVSVKAGSGDVRATLRIPPPPDDAALVAPPKK